MLSLEEYSEGRTQPFHTRLETLLRLPCEPRQGMPRTQCRVAAQEHVGRGLGRLRDGVFSFHRRQKLAGQGLVTFSIRS